MERSDLTAFWSLPPTPADWRNLHTSRITRVMLPLSIASPDLLDALNGDGKRVVLRLTEEDVRNTDLAQLRERIRHATERVRIDAVIGPNEPEVDLDLTFEARTWGQARAEAHKRVMGALFLALAPLSITVVSPPWSHHGVGLGETDPLYPGLFTWREICAPVYSWCDGCGVHAYTHNWLGPVDEVRLKQAIRFWASFWHKPIWIDEIGIRNGPESQRVSAYLAVARWLCTEGNAVGERVKMLAPFVMNGNGQGWDPGYLITARASYEAIGRFMAGH